MPSYLIWYKRFDPLRPEQGASDGRIIAKTSSLMTEEELLKIEKKLDEESGGKYSNIIFSVSKIEE